MWLGTPAEHRSAHRLEALDAELADAVFMGADPDSYRAQQIERDGLVAFELFEENQDVFYLFNRLKSQRNYIEINGEPICIGLDYAGVMAYLLAFHSRKKSGRILDELMVIEKGFLQANHDPTTAGVQT